MESYKSEFIDFMVESDVLKFGEFTLKSGRKSPFFMNAGAYVTGSQLKRLGEYYAKAIHANYGDDFELCAGISGIANKDFKEMEKDALQALSDAMATNAEYVFAQAKEETLDEWLDDTVDKPKNYKIFKQIFNKKLEKVITPVFFRLQKAWEEKLFETEIEQSIGDDMCVFHLKNKKQDSTLRIIYPGFAKIMISITHEGLDSPENKEIQLPLTKISQKELVGIIEDFIKDFKYTSV